MIYLLNKLKFLSKYNKVFIKLSVITISSTGTFYANNSNCLYNNNNYNPTFEFQNFYEIEPLNYFKNCYDSINLWIRLIRRFVYLSMIYFPLVVLSPILLLHDNFYHQLWYNWLVSILSISGPCFIKLGQYISIRPDLFPTILCNNLKPLQRNTITFVNSNTIKILENLSQSHNISIVKDINDRPMLLGSGCVAQVFKGIMNNKINETKQQKIAIKIINPTIKQQISDDLSILLSIAKTLEFFPIFQYLSIVDSINEFSILLLNQLDMSIEYKNLEKFHQNFQRSDSFFSSIKKLSFSNLKFYFSNSKIHFPMPFYVIDNSILIESYESGIPMIAMLNENQNIKHELALLGLHTIFKMIFEDNFIHADLHPGNILVRQNNDKSYELCLLDVGIVSYLTPLDRKNFIDLFKALILNNGREVGKLLIERSRQQNKVKHPEIFIESINKIVDNINESKSLNQINISYYLQKVFELCYKHQVKLESRYITILLGLGIVEGLGRQLDNNIDILSYAIPYVIEASLNSN